ncbi:glycosyltransferase family 1 protein [Pengzhenrongella frigida]|uniref:Glycosyltransferase family 1 protein n=1 Tax=Pengzhenrongella frigida TaxID=1259133 RepID=A0A4Q5N043_9MICO|nr:glycosyltransferase family 1 protein [Cellulomonas sp. HLT2-17]
MGLTVEQCWQRVPGGSATYIVELAAALMAHPGVEPIGLAAPHRSPPGADFSLSIPVRSLGLPRAALYRLWNRAPFPRPEWTVHGLDVVHATTWAIPRTSRPLVVTVHDVAFLRDPTHFTPRGVRFFTRALERTRAEADVVIVPSQATAEDCIAAGIEADRIHVVPHGVHPVGEPTGTPHDLTLPARYVLWCGTLEPRKNVSNLLEAFGLVAGDDPDLHLVLVGQPGWGDVSITDLLAGRPWAARVHHLGRLSNADLRVAYRHATAFCFPSLWEGFGLPVLEAMSFGLPVITSVGTSMREITGDDAGILVEPTSPTDIARGIRAACGPEHARLAAASLDRSLQFTWAHAAELTAAAYAQATGS